MHTRMRLEHSWVKNPWFFPTTKTMKILPLRNYTLYSTHLPLRVASALAIFQRTMNQILQGITGVICYTHDILVTGSNSKEQLQRLDEVLKKAQISWARAEKKQVCVLSKCCGVHGSSSGCKRTAYPWK